MCFDQKWAREGNGLSGGGCECVCVCVCEREREREGGMAVSGSTEEAEFECLV